MRTVVGGGRDTHDGHENSPILVFFSNLLDVAARWDRSVVLLLIDGNHDHVREDFEAWKVHLARGAVVVFHDSNFPERKHASPYVSEVVEALIGEYQLEVLARIDRLTTVRWEGDH